MLGINSSLYFPNFHYLNHVHFKKGDNSREKEGIALYSLDWTKKDQKRCEHHQKWLQDYWSKCKIPFMPSLPEKYDTWIKNLTFAIPQHYKEEISRNSRRGFEEWNVRRSFDTNIREFCLNPAIWHIYVAFYLIADCVYDPETNYYSRNGKNILVPHCLAYKFWAHQTGRGRIADHANFDKIEKLASFDYMSLHSGNKDLIERSELCGEFLKDIKVFEQEWDNAYKQQSVGIESSDIPRPPEPC